MGYQRDTETATIERRNIATGGAACGGQYEWRALNTVLVVQLGVNANKAKVFKAHAAPLWLCDNLINELTLPANQ